MAFLVCLAVLVAFGAGIAIGMNIRTKAVENSSELITKALLEPRPILGGVVEAIRDANPARHHANLWRRIMKVMEELGEAVEAYLNVTSAANGKKKTWADVREELADAVIVAVDCALTPTPDQEKMGVTKEQVQDEFVAVIGRKLDKWRKNRDTGKAATDAE